MAENQYNFVGVYYDMLHTKHAPKSTLRIARERWPTGIVLGFGHSIMYFKTCGATRSNTTGPSNVRVVQVESQPALLSRDSKSRIQCLTHQNGCLFVWHGVQERLKPAKLTH